VEGFLASLRRGTKALEYRKKSNIFMQGEEADTLFYIRNGRVKLTGISPQGKAATLAVLNNGSFFGEGCIAGQPRRMMTAGPFTDCSLLRLERHVMTAALSERPDFSKFFFTFVMSRNIRYEADLTDLLFNSSEKRLARILLLLARYGKAGQPERIVPKVTDGTLAQMVGTTRQRINHFMNKFRSLGLIEYNDGLEVHSSLTNVILHD
jgi:CRP/FNR family cyclic AMP-dependent transcriptional regulator